MYQNPSRLMAMCCLLLMIAGQAGAQSSIRVLVYGEHRGANIVYHYTVVNNGSEAFNNFVIGSEYDKEENYTFPRLGRLPVGWRYGKTGETGREIILDPASTTQPAGWSPLVYGQQDTAFFI